LATKAYLLDNTFDKKQFFPRRVLKGKNENTFSCQGEQKNIQPLIEK